LLIALKLFIASGEEKSTSKANESKAAFQSLQRSISSSSQSTSNPSTIVASNKLGDTSKVTLVIFSNGATEELAAGAKTHMRLRTIYGEVFLPSDIAQRNAFSWKVIREAVEIQPALTKSLEIASKDSSIKKNLIKYVCFLSLHFSF
jgi:hypothetical protein